MRSDSVNSDKWRVWAFGDRYSTVPDHNYGSQPNESLHTEEPSSKKKENKLIRVPEKLLI